MSVHQGYHRAMNRLIDRIDEALRAKGLSVSALETACGVKRGQFATAFKRLREKEGSGMSPESIRRIADALKVSPDWLAWGLGDQDLGVRAVSHQRRQALKLAAGRGISEAVLAAVEEEPDTTPPRTVDQWTDVILALVQADKHLSRALQATPTPPPASDVEPTRVPKLKRR